MAPCVSTEARQRREKKNTQSPTLIQRFKLSAKILIQQENKSEL